MQQLRSNIHGPEDLSGKRVAVVQGSTSADYVRQFGHWSLAYDQVDECYDALLTGTVDAVVADAPNLLYYVKNQGKGRVAVVGKLFAPQDYAIAVRRGSPLRKQINLALVTLAETAEVKGIRAKWFGNLKTLVWSKYSNLPSHWRSRLSHRLRLAADLYNLGLTLGLSTPDRDHVLLEVGRQPLPFGTLTLAIDPEQFVWGGHRMGHFIPVAECKLRGLLNRYRQPGVGAPHELSKGGLESALRQTYMRHGRGLQGSAAACYCQ